MLTVLLHSGIGEIVAVSTRWFGGTKLGTGGLSRAYSAGVQHALEGLPTELKVDRVTMEVTTTYEHVTALRRLFDELDASVASESYGESVRWQLGVPRDQAHEFKSRTNDITSGAVEVKEVQDPPRSAGEGDSSGAERT
jgi:putative IMPACT (imprinted ancient) family translation regulator